MKISDGTFKEKQIILGSEIRDFARKVTPIYKLLEWEWLQEGGEMRIPTQEEIEDTLYELLSNLGDKARSVSTGGLCAFYDEDDGTMGIEFTVSEKIDVY